MFMLDQISKDPLWWQEGQVISSVLYFDMIPRSFQRISKHPAIIVAVTLPENYSVFPSAYDKPGHAWSDRII